MSKQTLVTLLRVAALAGNVVFMLWVVFNAMDSEWKGTRVEILSAFGLVIVLLLNSYFLVATMVRKSN